MLRVLLALFSVSAALSAVYGQVDYCDEDLCGTSTHIACDNDVGWGASCPTSPAPSLMVFDLAKRQHVVRMHNVRRNNLALGKLANYQPAKRMATIRWSPEMAKIAAFNVQQCVMQHDECRNTQKFSSSGQNLAFIGYTGAQSTRSDQDLLTQAINMWWNENKNANMAVINKYPNSWVGPAIGHFTVMARESNIAVGCAGTTYFERGMNNVLIACNYATTNFIGRPVYVRGTAASGCKTGKNVNYAGLCKVNEAYTL
ncbi:antigen 5 like allergen Cul n 1 [Drosophila grimshawi]|uniref:Venom allergen-1 n=1 Tax=Drosophila grimshawi TaxID=7222 RepID=B4JJN6_DROGR|nr:antigen 5 like allergen Cul n 1 [Drosophila grimshawi]EDV99788.1 GH12213 [Drosophila grimshawi]